jgi:hypothetical protein
MRKLLVLFLLFLASSAMAQYVPNTHWPYVYENFVDGTIYFSNNQKSSAKLNIHLWGNVLHYVSKDSKIFESSDKDVIRVEIGNDAYMYGDHKLMQIIAEKTNCVLLKLTKADFDSMFSGSGAYGSSLNSSATKDVSSMDLGGMDKPELGKMLEEKKDGREIPLQYQYYYIIKGKLVDASKKDVSLLLDKNEIQEFDKFLKTNNIKWKKESSMIDVLNFLQTIN